MIHDAKPGDIYVDEKGKLWRVMATISEPSVEIQEVESTLLSGEKATKSGGIGGLMWQGFKRIYRRSEE